MLPPQLIHALHDPQTIYLTVIASLFGIASFMFTDMLLLRSIYLLSSLFFIISGILFTTPITMVTNLVYVVVNVFQITRIILERSIKFLPKELRPVYEKFFTDMYPQQFLKLTKLATKEKLVGKNHILINKGAELPAFFLTLRGNAIIERDHAPPIIINPPSFIGEMHFLTDEPASETVKIVDELVYLKWHIQDIQLLKKRMPTLYSAFLSSLGKDLIQKILVQNKAAVTTQQESGKN